MNRELNPLTSSTNTSEPWRVGVLFSTTGFMALIEETQLRGTLTAIDEINDAGGINGRPIEPLIYDPASEAAAFGRLAKKMMVEDGLTSIFGCYTSSSRKAVLPVIERLNGLLWYPTLYEGFEFSPNVVYTGAAPNQNSVELCAYLMENYGTRFYFIGSDYVYPRESNRIMRELVRHNNGSVVGERYIDLMAKREDYLPVMREIHQLQPDVIFSTVVGDGTVYLYQSYTEYGFDPKVMPIASLTTTEAEINAMGYDVGEGHVTAAPYFHGLKSEQNDAFEQRYRKRYGSYKITNMCLQSAYFQFHIFAKALEQTNSLETEVLRPVVLGTEFDAPQGKVSINPTYSHTDLWTRIGRANRNGSFDLLWESSSSVKADPYLIAYGRSLVYG